MKPIRVLVIDDSPTMRALISSRLRRDPGLEVVGGAGDPLEAREMIKALNPDVLTLDVEMPRMNGIEFLEKLMRLRPMPVVMVSTLTQEGAEATLQALELGAFDCVGKPAASEMAHAFDDLADKVRAAANSRVRAAMPRPSEPLRASAPFRSNGRIIAIGASTGGVEALITLLSAFPENCPPTVVTQHMPATFTKSFAARLDRLCAAHVTEAEDGDALAHGRVYIAPGGARHLEVGGATPSCRLREADLINGHRPSVDALFNSVAATSGARAVGVILTGMGKDGARGLAAMRAAGARTFGQDEASCVVYGMPKAAFEIGAVERQAPLTELSKLVLEACTNAVREPM